MQSGPIPMDTGRKLIIALLVINIGLSIIIVPDIVLSKQNNEAITDALSSLLGNQQKLVSDEYLISSSNNLLITNQKQALTIAEQQHTLASQQLNQTNKLLSEIYKGDSKADILAQHVNALFDAIYNGDSKADRVLKNVTAMFGQIQDVVNNHTMSFQQSGKQLAIITPIIIKIGRLLNVSDGNYILRHQLATYLHQINNATRQEQQQINP